MLRKLKQFTVGGLAVIGGLVVSAVVAVVGSAYVQFYGRKNYQLIDKYEGQPYE